MMSHSFGKKGVLSLSCSSEWQNENETESTGKRDRERGHSGKRIPITIHILDKNVTIYNLTQTQNDF